MRALARCSLENCDVAYWPASADEGSFATLAFGANGGPPDGARIEHSRRRRSGCRYPERYSCWTVGTGLEWAFARNWTAKLEYDFIDFGTQPETIPLGVVNNLAGGGGTVSSNSPTINVRETVSLVKVGINYKMGPGFLFW
jgi:hypothetical protein